MFWIVVAILTAFVALALVWPLARKPGQEHEEQPNEVAVYQDQLRELDRERESGLIGEAEADYARAEIGRRLIAAADKAINVAKPHRFARINRTVANVVLAIVPIFGLCLYLSLGSPEQPDMPLAARLENPGDNLDLMLAKIERHLAQNPDDSKGWDVVAPVYLAAGRLADAQNAFRSAIRIDGENVARLTGLGETLVNANDGIVIGEAKALFQRVMMVDPSNPRAQFYTGLAAQQSGRNDEAKRIYEQLLASSPANAPWVLLVRDNLARLDGSVEVVEQPVAVKGPTSADVEAASQMSNDDRQAMIQSMVSGLEEKLKEEPKNIDGWLQLLRSYSVLGNKAKAEAALGTALQVYAPNTDERRRLLDMARAAGLSELGGVQ